jgi:hypothetical protein
MGLFLPSSSLPTFLKPHDESSVRQLTFAPENSAQFNFGRHSV